MQATVDQLHHERCARVERSSRSFATIIIAFAMLAGLSAPRLIAEMSSDLNAIIWLLAILVPFVSRHYMEMMIFAIFMPNHPNVIDVSMAWRIRQYCQAIGLILFALLVIVLTYGLWVLIEVPWR